MPVKLDITNDHCPMTFVKVKLALAKLVPGDELDVTMTGEEPIANIPKAAAEQGHTVLEATERDGHFHVVIRKGR
jgi:tRNA 2-thiouridine synthesizing protein A